MTADGKTLLHAALVDCLAALDLSLDEAQIHTLIGYTGLLQRWNAVYNLTAVRDPAAVLTHHLADCLAVIKPLQRQLGDQRATLLDVGSGGGLPAVVIAAALPSVAVTSVDAVAKKVAFVRQVAAELQLKNLSAVHARVEALKAPPFDVITCRAFASLHDFVRGTEPLLRHGGTWMAMKGRRPNDEIAALPEWAEMFHVEQLHVPGLPAERCLVWVRHREPPTRSL